MNSFNRPVRSGLVAACIAALVALVAACSSTEAGPTPGPSPAQSSSNQSPSPADSVFVTQLAALSAQAVAISNAALAKSESPEDEVAVREAIRSNEERLAQLRQMTGAVPINKSPDIDAPGLLTEDELVAVLSATGAEFARLSAEAATRLGDGMVSVSQAELDAGTYPPARRLAQSIVDTRPIPVPTSGG